VEGAALLGDELRVFDPEGNPEVSSALKALGIEATTEQLGSALMAAANDNLIAGVIVSARADEELRELFMRAFRARHKAVPVVYLSAEAGNAEVVARHKTEGATAVLPWPLPGAGQVVPVFKALFPAVMSEQQAPAEAGFGGASVPAPVLGELPASALTPIGGAAPAEAPSLDKTPSVATRVPRPPEVLGATSVPDDEASVLRRKLGDLEDAQTRQPPGVPADAFERAVQEVAQKAQENTELRSELTLIRDRNVFLEERLRRLRDELEQLTRERDQLLGDEPSSPSGGFDELRGGVESYTHAMGAAIDFLEDLQHRVGKRAPSLDSHVRTMKLVNQLLLRLQHEAKGGDG
jgi:hypothetical protein